MVSTLDTTNAASAQPTAVDASASTTLMQAKKSAQKRMSWRRRTLNALGSLFLAAGTGAAGLGIGLNVNLSQPHSRSTINSTPVFSQPTSSQFRIEPITVPDEILLGPLLDYLDSSEFKAIQEQQRLLNLSKAKETLETARTESIEIITGANEQAENIALDANYAIATKRSHGPEGDPAILQFQAEIISSSDTATGCDITMRNTETGQHSLITNLAKGSCAAPGTYAEGSRIARYGRYAVGTKSY